MSRADRIFLRVVMASVLLGGVLALPLFITLAPGAFQRAAHGYEALAQQCAAALYRLGISLPPLGILVIGLTAATAIFGTWRAVRMLSCTRRAIQQRRAIEPPRRLRAAALQVGIVDRVGCFDDRRAFAYCAGILRPRVWVSSGAVRRLRREELEAVLWHEGHHLERRDPLRILVVRILSSALFAVPLIRSLGDRFELAKELDADQAALRAQAGAKGLAGALYKLGQPRLAASDLAIGAWSMTRARVDQVCGVAAEELLPRPGARALWLSAAALAAALLLGLGQAARANVVPAAVLDAISGSAWSAEIHECPLPREGFLL